MKNITKEGIIKFEEDIAECYSQGLCKGVVHLRGGREEQLIEIFELVQPEDYIFGYWFSH